jgi:hypothetical protein
VPQLTPLYNASYLSIQIPPDHIKRIAKERPLAIQSNAESRWGSIDALSTIHPVIAHMEQAGGRMDLAEFLYFSEKTDREFKDGWRKACLELVSLLGRRS